VAASRFRSRWTLWLPLALTLLPGAAAHAGHRKDSPDNGKGMSYKTIVYDRFEKPGGYTMADYLAKWSNPYGPGEMAVSETRTFAGGGFGISAVPFQTGYDFSVFDHIKYLATSNDAFLIPADGSVEFSIDIDAETPGTQPGRVIEGTYSQSGDPYAQPTLEGQQAGATLHMIDFGTGQLFDWFVSGHTAFTLYERLPSSVTGSPNFVGRDLMYTQIIDEVKLKPGRHTVSIRYTREPVRDRCEWFLDGKRVSQVQKVGVPLDVQNADFTGIYPSMGPGEPVRDQLTAVVIGHGLFSLLDAFPFQHPDAPELAVSIPIANRLFGQGARATFDNVKVTVGEKKLKAHDADYIVPAAIPRLASPGAASGASRPAPETGALATGTWLAAGPNPAHGALRLTFALAQDGPVRLSVYDAQGRNVATLADGPFTAGRHEVGWNGASGSRGLRSGVYYARLEAGGRALVRRFAIVE